MARIGFVLCSPVSKPIPSTRIAVLNMMPFLRLAGLNPSVIFEPHYPNETPHLSEVLAKVVSAGCDLVVMQKVRGPSAVALARELAAIGVRTIYSVCDLVDIPMVEATDATLVVTDYLKSLCPQSLQTRIYVVHDGIERPSACKAEWNSYTKRTTSRSILQAVLVTSADLDRLPVLRHPPRWVNVRIVGRYARGFRRLQEIRWKWDSQPTGERLSYLRFLIDRRIECVPWNLEGVYHEMLQAQVAIIPVDTQASDYGAANPPPWMVKSENRLTMKMSVGLPVIATPIPSYEKVIEHGVNGFFARSSQDWTTCLNALRDPYLRREIGLAARASVAEKYSTEEQAVKLISVIRTVLNERA
jgi:glycosyltransferase involved in cell wall biosynthesis